MILKNKRKKELREKLSWEGFYDEKGRENGVIF